MPRKRTSTTLRPGRHRARNNRAAARPHHTALSDYRIGYLLENPSVPVSSQTKAGLETAVLVCEKAGATLKSGWPGGFRLSEMMETYVFLLDAFIFSMMPAEQQKRQRESAANDDSLSAGARATYADWQPRNLKRLAYRAMWEEFFQSVDVFLLPTVFTAAFPHDHSPQSKRTLSLPEGGSAPYRKLLDYIAPATLTDCPATTAPVGLSNSGLPVGIQIVGPHLEDLATIHFARLLAQEIGGFPAPKSYAT